MAIRRIAPIRLLTLNKYDRHSLPVLARFGGGIFLSSATAMMLSPLNKLMLSRYAGVSAIPVYEIAFTGAFKIRSVIDTGLRALMPEISRLSVSRDSGAQAKLIRMNRYALKRTVQYGLPLFVAVILLTGPFFRFWFASDCNPQLITCFQIMLIGVFFSLIAVPAYYTDRRRTSI